jgi:hypothetical protein
MTFLQNPCTNLCMSLTGHQGKRIPKLPSETSIYIQGSGSDLYERIAKETGYSVHRLRITKADDGKPIPNDKKSTVSSVGLENGSTIQVKDLGMWHCHVWLMLTCSHNISI